MTALAGEASAGTRGSSGRRARTPRRGRVMERVGNLQGASARSVDKAPKAEDAEDKEQGRRLLSGVCRCNIARLAGERGAESARAGRRRASMRRVDRTPDDGDPKDRRSEVGACSSEGVE